MAGNPQINVVVWLAVDGAIKIGTKAIVLPEKTFFGRGSDNPGLIDQIDGGIHLTEIVFGQFLVDSADLAGTGWRFLKKGNKISIGGNQLT